MAGVGVSRFEAEAKNWSEKETTDAPRTEVVRFVVLEKVVSICEAGTELTDSWGLVVGVAKDKGRIFSSTVSGGMEGISIATGSRLVDSLCA